MKIMKLRLNTSHVPAVLQSNEQRLFIIDLELLKLNEFYFLQTQTEVKKPKLASLWLK